MIGHWKGEFDCDSSVKDEEGKDGLNHRAIDNDEGEEGELQYEPSISRRASRSNSTSREIHFIRRILMYRDRK